MVNFLQKGIKAISLGGIGEYIRSQPTKLKSFTYTGSDQVYEIPEDGKYTFKVKGAGSNNAKGGYAEGTFTLTKGDKISVMVGQNGGSTSSATYGFGGSGNYGSDRAGGGLSGVFTGSTSITASDSARAMIIAGGAGAGNSKGNGGAGGGETGQDGQGGSYGTAGSGGTQTGHGSAGNKGANQFNGGNGSGTYGQGGGGGWRGGNSSIGDSSADDDRNGGGGSGYVLSTAEGRVLTQGGGADAKSNGSIEMYQSVKVYKGNVQKVMLGEVQVWPESEPEPGWTPGVNTIAYYPLNKDFNDYSDKGKNLTNTGSPSIVDLNGVKCARYTSGVYSTWTGIVGATATNRTVSTYINTVNTSVLSHIVGVSNTDNYGVGGLWLGQDSGYYVNHGGDKETNLISSSNKRNNIILTQEGSTVKIYVNGVLDTTTTGNTITGLGATNPNTIGVGRKPSTIYSNYPEDNNYDGYLSDVIIENKTWTVEEVLQYYNQTKGNYGLT